MLKETTYTQLLEPPSDDINSVHSILETIWSDNNWVGEVDRMSFDTALVELASNVIKHISAEQNLSCLVTVKISPDRIEAIFVDTGKLVNIELKNHLSIPDEFSESGRGMPLINALVDQFIYTRSGKLNQWKIVRELTHE